MSGQDQASHHPTVGGEKQSAFLPNVGGENNVYPLTAEGQNTRQSSIYLEPKGASAPKRLGVKTGVYTRCFVVEPGGHHTNV